MYSPLCRCCRSDSLAAIDLALARGVGCGVVARRYGVSIDSARRHKKHIPPGVWERLKKNILVGDDKINLAKLRESESERMLSRLVTQRLSLQKLIADAEAKEDLRCAIQGQRVLLENLAAEARLLSDLGVLPSEKPTLTNSAAYLALRARLIAVLRDYPDARRAVLKAFGIVEQEESTAIGVSGEPERLPAPEPETEIFEEVGGDATSPESSAPSPSSSSPPSPLSGELPSPPPEASVTELVRG